MSDSSFTKDIAFKASEYSEAREYWIDKLSGHEHRSSFPYDLIEKDTQDKDGGNRYEEIEFRITGRLHERITHIANKSDLRLFLVLATGLVILLHKYTGDEDIIIGSPIEKQPEAGNYLNTILALRSVFSASNTVKELLIQFRQTVVDAIEKQDFPLDKLPYELNLEISENDAFALFDTAILLDNLHDEEYISHLSLNAVFSFHREDNEISAVVRFNPFRYKRSAMERITGHYIQLLQQAFFEMDRRIIDIDVITPQEKELVLVAVNDSNRPYPDSTIHRLIEEQAARTPGKTAIESADTGQVLTYREMNRQANLLAGKMLNCGITPGTIVALMGERTPEIVIAILAILKTGAVFLPLDAQNPDQRLRFILEDSGTAFFLSQKKIIQQRETLFRHFPGGHVIAMDDEDLYRWEEQDDPAGTNPGPYASPTDLAYIIYTSGTTGNPKGVQIEHKSLVNYIQFAMDNYVKGENLNFPLYSSIAFDLTITSIFTPLASGNSVIVYSGWDKGNLIERIVDDNKAGVVKLTPSHLNLISNKKISPHSKIKRFIVGGEALKYGAARTVFDNANGRVEIYNEYGPTEATVGCMIYRFDPIKDAAKGSTVSIGRPAANARIYLLDKNRRPAPPGATGEIYIAGLGLARGYLNRPQLTAERFVNFKLPISNAHDKNHPISSSLRLYRTGDLARWHADGNLEFLERIDHQVKIRGFRIELGEIENQLMQHPSVKEAVTLVKQSPDRHVRAYVTAGEEIDPGEIREYLTTRLPDYMIPLYIVQMEAIPLNRNGKVDLNALPEPETFDQTPYVAPFNEAQQTLVEIWSDILGLETSDIGIDANFFKLGGHSLSGTILAAKIHKAFDIKLALSDLFRFPTVRELDRHLEQSIKSQFAAIEPVEKKEYYPLSSAQERLFIIDRIAPGSIGYNVPIAYRIEGDLNLETLNRVFRQLISRHSNLRTSFILIDESPVQRIHDDVPFEIPFFDVSAGKPEEEATAIVQDFIHPFDFSSAPLLRAGVIKLKHNAYVLVMDIHHIITDGVSMDIFIKEFGALYNGRKPAPPVLDYKDFSHWQNSAPIREQMKKQEDYWLERFQGEIPILQLPLDFPRPIVRGFEGDRVNFRLDDSLVNGLRDLAAAQDCTLFMTLLSLYTILLAKLSGQRDIVVGSPIAGRKHTDLENIMGLFINTLALRNHPEGEKTFMAFLDEVKTHTMDAYENQEYQYEELVAKVAVKRDVGRNPLSDAMFALNNVDTQFLDIPEFDIPGLTFSSFGRQLLIAKMDLLLSGMDTGANLLFSLEYSTRLFKEETALRFADYFKNLAAHVLENPMQTISDLEIIGPREKRQLLYEFNDNPVQYPENQTLYQVIQDHALKYPDNPALEFEDQTVSYRYFDRRANQLAHYLRKETGIRAGGRVAVLMDRSVELVVALLAVIKAGAAFVPIDATLPEQRLRIIFNDASIPAAISINKYREKLSRLKEQCHSLHTILEMDQPGAHYSAYSPEPQLAGKDSEPAYIMYTSGSTGIPKGVLVEHRTILNTLTWRKEFYHFAPRHRSLQIPPYYFDSAISDILTPLLSGSRLVMIREEQRADVNALHTLIVKYKISHLILVPVFYNLMLEGIAGSLNSLEAVTCAGDSFPDQLIKKHFECLPRTRIINEYGPTENSVNATVYEFTPGCEKALIGKPIPNVSIYILDRYGKLCARGVTGEICLAGSSLARGYLNRPGQTAEKFVHSPITHPASLIYKTGDLGRWLPDGNLEFLGRIDHQVKIRGHRIETAEIENVLTGHPALHQVVVAAKQDLSGDKYLCVYYVPAREKEELDIEQARELDALELKNYLGAKFPEYMIPTHFAALDKIPVDKHGKIDRKALPEPGITIDDNYTAPRDYLETRLAALWMEVLGRGAQTGEAAIGIDSNFFELGGHSLKATTLATRIHKELDIKVPLAEIFKIPTIRGLSEYMRHHAAAPGQDDRYTNLEPASAQDYYPSSLTQKRFYIMQTLNPENTGYNLPSMLDIEGNPDSKKLAHAFQQLIQRHESLRTSFELTGGNVVQRVHDHASLEIETFQAPEEKVKEAVKAFIRPFKLDQAPLMRVGLVKINPARHILLTDMHHIITDGLSLDILAKEFSLLYEGRELPPLRLQYKDYCLWQNSEPEKKRIREQGRFWAGQFQDTPPVLNLRTDFPRPPVQRFDGAVIDFEISESSARALNQLAVQKEASLFMVLLTIYYVLLRKLTGQSDFVVGSGVLNRGHADLMNIIGLFFNTIPLRNKVDENLTFNAFLDIVRDNTLRAFENQDYPLDMLVEDLINQGNLKRNTSRNPLFDTMFALQNLEGVTSAPVTKGLSGLKVKSFQLEKTTARFDLFFTAVRRPSSVSMRLEYSTVLFKPGTAKKITQYYMEIMEQVLENSAIPIADIDISGNLLQVDTIAEKDEYMDFGF